ncbi:hypothetical protein [Marinicella meishanensis]|uniref:hypothetical protein n=1 Tax=Marinicella meishanensis TaxID=2873263 RepID=UPI001CC0FAD9|nr:hypothetical protein [Marinicella sp. NBU2979]
MITWQTIEQTHATLLDELQQLVPLSDWQHPPQGIKPSGHKTKYGMADLAGWVHINQAFIGSNCGGLLEATIRHELAHLCVGLQCGHDHRFKAMERRFEANFGPHLHAEAQQLQQAIGHRYLLFAELADGTDVLLKRVHRRHRKYTHYRPGWFRYLTIDGQKVQRFRYQLAADPA